MYSVQSDSLLKSLSILVDDALVFSKSYTKNQKEDISSANIDLSNYAPWRHTITVQAIDASWRMNRASIIDVLQSTDDEPPFIVFEQSRKQSLWNGKYQINLIFDDHLSWIPWGNISIEWKTVTSFDWRLASFTTNSESFDVHVKDNYGNELNQTVTLNEIQQ